MKHAPLILALSCMTVLAGCEKELTIDYRDVEPIYVVEATVNNSLMEARVSQTNAMDDNNTVSTVNGATVSISGSDGSVTRLAYTRNGYYRADKKGTPGVTYTIDITIGDGHHFSATSTMQQPPQFSDFRFVRKKMMTEWFQMADLRIQDLPNEDNWYFMHLYRNDTGYRWAVMRDNVNPNKELQQLFTLFREGSGDSDVLREGDQLRLEIRTIDEAAYDYLFSMQMMESTGTNPVQNFSGGCLGYFSAYSSADYHFTYHAADVVDDDE